jgi:hypothetical protein
MSATTSAAVALAVHLLGIAAALGRQTWRPWRTTAGPAGLQHPMLVGGRPAYFPGSGIQ